MKWLCYNVLFNSRFVYTVGNPWRAETLERGVRKYEESTQELFEFVKGSIHSELKGLHIYSQGRWNLQVIDLMTFCGKKGPQLCTKANLDFLLILGKIRIYMLMAVLFEILTIIS